MARKKNNIIDDARQRLKKSASSTIKGTFKNISKEAAARKRDAAKKHDKETVAQWRALKKVGLINTRSNPAMKNITPAIKRRVKKEFFDMQGAGHYSHGKVFRPLERVVKETKRGESISYKLNEAFHFYRTKKKTEQRRGVIKTNKGYIIEKRNKNEKVSIAENGDVIRKLGKQVRRQRAYTGRKILDLYRDIKSGKIKIRPNETLIYKPWGSERMLQNFDEGTEQDFLDLVDQYATQMNMPTFEKWLDHTELEFARNFEGNDFDI